MESLLAFGLLLPVFLFLGLVIWQMAEDRKPVPPPPEPPEQEPGPVHFVEEPELVPEEADPDIF